MEQTHFIKELKKQAFEIRKRFLKMHFEAKAGHIGSGLSSIELLTYIYKAWMRSGDQFILSKGHGASALYATLRHAGLLSEEVFQTYYKDNTTLPVHPAALAYQAIPVATGSLGHGFAIAAGMVYANQYLHGNDYRVACLLSDGECNEGSVWESALFAAHHRLRNLKVIIDANGLQGFGRTEEVLGLEPFQQKWEAFGFQVHPVNGHDFKAIHSAFSQVSDKPSCILARTIKGKGVSFMEDKMEWHYLPMKEEQYQQALRQLEKDNADL